MTQTHKKVSAVVPAHNEEANIEHVIQALLAQDYPNLEIIVVDNASSDRTGEIARQLADSATQSIRSRAIPAHKIIVVHEPKKGLLSAREAGRKIATGLIVANIDADCSPEIDWISRGAAHFDDSNTVAVTGPYDYYDGGRIFRSISLLTQRLFYYPINYTLQYSLVRRGAVLIGGNNFIRADVLNRLGGYDTSILFYGEDTDTAKKVASHGRIHFDKGLTMKTSARRFKSEGTLKLIIMYWFHFAKVITGGSKRPKGQ